ncbi:unnamed protein product [Arctogadus glacialis]
MNHQTESPLNQAGFTQHEDTAQGSRCRGRVRWPSGCFHGDGGVGDVVNRGDMLPREPPSEVADHPGEGGSDSTRAAQRVDGATPPPAPLGGVVEVRRGPRLVLPEPCPHCGQPVPPRTTAPRPSGPPTSTLHGSDQSVSSKRGRGGDSRSPSTAEATDNASFLGLLLACLSCQCSVVLLGLLEACSACLHHLCACCCHCCGQCCAEACDAPAETFSCHAHCHAVVFESCCESTECLEFCLDCCLICHHS